MLTGLKLGVGFLSGSVGVISEGIHSLLDLVSVAVGFFSIQAAGKPADQDHPFGHGKIETLSSLFEALLLVAAAGWIVYEGVDHLLHPREIQYQTLAMISILVSLGVSYAVYRNNIKAAQETESSAIHVNALHFLADVIASAGVLIGLLLLRWTGWLMIDPIVAFSVAGYILLISAKQVKMALLELTDTQLPVKEVKFIQTILNQFQNKIIETHDLRTRRSGVTRHIDFHLVVCGEDSVHSSHALCDEIEGKILEKFSNASINIHVEPCEHKNDPCEHTVCIADCPLRKKRQAK